MSILLRRAHSLLDYLGDVSALRARLRWPIFNWDIYSACRSLSSQGLVFDTILDVGANVGVFALTAAHFFPGALLQLFEPIPECQRQLTGNLRRIDPARWRLWTCALGSKPGEAEIHVDDFSPSSSLLPMSEAHQLAFPGTGRSRPLRVPISTLDIVEPELGLQARVLLKLDVQGYELEVLKGGGHLLQHVSHVLVETSFVRLYEGQPLHDTVDAFLVRAGFRFCGPYAVRQESKSGRVLQMDALYARGVDR